jgi:hypothetical protein
MPAHAWPPATAPARRLLSGALPRQAGSHPNGSRRAHRPRPARWRTTGPRAGSEAPYSAAPLRHAPPPFGTDTGPTRVMACAGSMASWTCFARTGYRSHRDLPSGGDPAHKNRPLCGQMNAVDPLAQNFNPVVATLCATEQSELKVYNQVYDIATRPIAKLHRHGCTADGGEPLAATPLRFELSTSQRLCNARLSASFRMPSLP